MSLTTEKISVDSGIINLEYHETNTLARAQL